MVFNDLMILNSEHLVITTSRVWLDLCVGPLLCGSKPNVDSIILN